MLLEERAVLLQRPLRDLGQGLGEGLAGLFVADGLEGTRREPDLEDTLHGGGLEGAIAQRMLQRRVDVLGQVAFLELKDVAGVGPALSGVLLQQSLQERLGRVTEGQKRLADRLEAVAGLLGLKVPGKLDALRQPAWGALVPCDELQPGAIDEDLVLGCLDGEDVGGVADD